MGQRARVILVVLLSALLSGGERWFAENVALLHYGFDAVLVICALLAARSAGSATGLMRAAWPYLTFLVCYIAWGLLVSPDPGASLGAAVSMVLLNVLVVVGVVTCLSSRTALTWAASAFQVVAVGAAAVCLLEVVNPDLVSSIAHSLSPDATVFNIDRPAALWVNANVAGPAFLFIFLMSFWSVRWLAWIGRFAAATGILLGQSREALYPLIVFSVVIAVHALVQRSVRRGSVRRISAGTLVGVAAGAGIVVAGVSLASADFGTGDQILSTANLSRLFDVTQSQQPIDDPSRIALASESFDAAANGPWQGAGLFSFEGGTPGNALGAHDTYIALWGEAGPLVVLAYIALLAWLLREVIVRVRGTDRLVLVLLWVGYVFEGTVSHNQLTAVTAILYAAVIFRLPGILAAPERAADPHSVETPGIVRVQHEALQHALT